MKVVVDEKEVVENSVHYPRLVGKLLYLTAMQPDISFVVQQLSQFLSNPYDKHLQVAYQVLKYLNVALGLGLYNTQ